MTTKTEQRINISVDGIWAGSGKVSGGYIADCGAVFASGQDESETIYDMIDDAIAEGKDSLKIEHEDGTTHRYTWTITSDE